MSERLANPSWRPQRQASLLDPQVKRLGLIAGGVAAVMGLGVAGYTLLGSGPRSIPVIEADSRPIRVKPDNPGGMQVAGADEQIMGGSSGDATVMAPPAEAPAPQALQAQIQAAKQAAAPAPVVAPAPAAAPAPVAAAPVASPIPDPHPAKLAPAKAAVAQAPATGMQVQLAAMTSEQGATAEWQRLSHLLPAVFGSHKPDVQKADVNGKTFYRLRTGGFTSTAQATAFCTEVKAKGANCSIASL